MSQLCVLAVIPAVCASTPTAAVSECTCSHGDHQVCPMHHPAQKSKTGCSCRSATDGPAAILSLIGQIGALPQPIDDVEVLTITGVAPRFEPSPLDTSIVPDAPPPRA